ncbi:MAG: dTMP kinase [Bacteroidota bacterium]
MFITFEGLDFCGKSTQVELLEKYFIDKKKKVIVLREPGGTPISEKIREILLDKKNSEMADETELLLFSASRSQLVNQTIIKSVESDYIVISDRFHDSSIAYQGFGRGIDLDFVTKLQNFAIGKAIPDLTFFIDIPVEEVVKRMSKVQKIELDRIENSKLDFYHRVRDGYILLAENNKRFRIIDGMLSKEDVNKIIITEVERFGKVI